MSMDTDVGSSQIFSLFFFNLINIFFGKDDV